MIQISLNNARKVLMRVEMNGNGADPMIEFSLKHGEFGVPTTVNMTVEEAFTVSSTLMEMVISTSDDMADAAERAQKDLEEEIPLRIDRLHHPREEWLLDGANVNDKQPVVLNLGGKMRVVPITPQTPVTYGWDYAQGGAKLSEEWDRDEALFIESMNELGVKQARSFDADGNPVDEQGLSDADKHSAGSKWGLIIHNAGGRDEYVQVFGGCNVRHPAIFSSSEDAETAADIISMLRTDSAFVRVSVYEVL